MTIKMDLKSLVIGIVATGVVLLAMGTVSRDRDAPKNADAGDSLKDRLASVEQRLFQKLTAPQSGRFQLRISRDNAVILDTATGQAWKHSLAGTKAEKVFPAKLQPAAN